MKKESKRNLFKEMIYKYIILPSAKFNVILVKRYLKKAQKELEEIKSLTQN